MLSPSHHHAGESRHHTVEGETQATDLEHLDPTALQGFVPPGVFALLREVVAKASLDDPSSVRAAIDALERSVVSVDRLARLGQLAVAGVAEAAAELRAWRPPQPSLVPIEQATRATALRDEQSGHGTGEVVFLFDRVFEVAVGFLVAFGAERSRCEEALRRLRNHLGCVMPVIERAYAQSLRARSGEGDTFLVADLLLTFGCGNADEPRVDSPLLAPVDAILHTVLHAAPSVREGLFVDQDPERLTQRIASLEVARQEVLRVTLKATADAPFPDAPPPGYAVFCECCGSLAQIERWAAQEIVAVLPGDAQPGAVWLSRKVPDRNALASLAATVARYLSPPECIQILSAPLHPLPVLSSKGLNVAAFVVPPVIRRFWVGNDRGEALDGRPVAPDERVVVEWAIASTDPNTSVAIKAFGQTFAVATVGVLMLDPGQQPGTVTITARNAGGETNGGLPSPLIVEPPSLTFEARYTCLRPGETRRLVISTRGIAAPPGLITLTLEDGVVRATAGSPLAGAPRLEVHVEGDVRPGRPVNLIVRAPGYLPVSIQVWVERPQGLWEDGPLLPAVAVHAALLKTGKLLVFSFDPADPHAIDKTKTALWDPGSGMVTEPPFPSRRHKNLFCSGHCMLADGRVLVTGGHSAGFESAAQEVHTFDPDTETWTKHRQMRHWRWYPTVAPLPDGRALILSGSRSLVGRPATSLLSEINPHVEVFEPGTGAGDPRANTTSFFEDAFPPIDCQAMYPHVFALPDRRLFVHLFDASRMFNAHTPPWRADHAALTVERVIRTDRGYVTCVMLPMDSNERRRVRIFVAGGSSARAISHINSRTPASDGVEILDYDADRWRTSGWTLFPERLPRPRFMSDAVLLPDGTVLIVNGAERGTNDDSSVPVFEPVIFDPRARGPAFTRMEPSSTEHPRLYHGTAILLPDARVAIGGHTKKFNPDPYRRDDFRLQLFSPPYLFRGPRPVIRLVKDWVEHGERFVIHTDDAYGVGGVTFIRCSSVSHQINTDQRCFSLRVLSRERDRLTVEAPVDPTLAVAGYYMLFLLSSAAGGACGRVPSVAWIVQLKTT